MQSDAARVLPCSRWQLIGIFLVVWEALGLCDKAASVNDDGRLSTCLQSQMLARLAQEKCLQGHQGALHCSVSSEGPLWCWPFMPVVQLWDCNLR